MIRDTIPKKEALQNSVFLGIFPKQMEPLPPPPSSVHLGITEGSRGGPVPNTQHCRFVDEIK